MPEHPSEPILEQRLRALEIEIDDLRERRSRAPTAARSARIRRIFVSLTVIMTIGLLPMVVPASDTFNDVPDSNPFHDAINSLAGAGITTGCNNTPPQFCPQEFVKRQAMAGFLNRGLGRATANQDATAIGADANDVEVASVTLTPGGVTGGIGFVLVTGSVSAFTTSGTTCPCEVGMRVADVTGGTDPGLWQFFDVSNTATPSTFRNSSGTMSWVFEVPSGTAREFAVMADIDMTGATGTLALQGQITAMYVPFGGTGGSTLGTTGVQGGSTPTDGRE